MRAVLQRVRSASVAIDGRIAASIGPGLLVLLAVAHADTTKEAARLAERTAHLRIFPDDAGRFDRSVQDIAGEVLVVSQFTLLADTRKGNRPSFAPAAAPEHAEPLVTAFIEALTAQQLSVATGVFGAHMLVTLENDGPVTILLDAGTAASRGDEDRSDAAPSVPGTRGPARQGAGCPGLNTAFPPGNH